jgi:hypothetical protein
MISPDPLPAADVPLALVVITDGRSLSATLLAGHESVADWPAGAL